MAQRQDDDVRKLRESGLAVVFETVGTLLQCTYSGEEDLNERDNILQWTEIGHGIPVVVANENGVALCLADFGTGDKLCSFTITEASQYTVIQEDFHIFTKPSGCFGLVLTNDSVANKLFVYLKRIVLSSSTAPEVGKGNEEENEGIEPACKRLCADTEDDYDEDDKDDVDGGEDDTDGIAGMASMRKKKKKKSTEISNPQDFKHVSHVGLNASVLELSHILSWKGTLNNKERISSQVISIPNSSRNEPGTEESSSFEEVAKVSSAPTPEVPAPPPVVAPPPPPPPPAVAPPPPKVQLKKKADSSAASNGGGSDAKSSLIDEIKKGVTLRRVGGDGSNCGSQDGKKTTYNSIQDELKSGVVLKTRSHTMTLPMPPKKRDSDQLMFDIRTFRKKKLRDISMTDFPARTAAPPDENSLESILKKRLDAMFHKISDSGEFSNTGTVNNQGEDTFDGVLFSDN